VIRVSTAVVCVDAISASHPSRPHQTRSKWSFLTTGSRKTALDSEEAGTLNTGASSTWRKRSSLKTGSSKTALSRRKKGYPSRPEQAALGGSGHPSRPDHARKHHWTRRKRASLKTGLSKTALDLEEAVIPQDRITQENITGLGGRGHPSRPEQAALGGSGHPSRPDQVKQHWTRRKRSSLKTGSRKKTSLDSEEEGIPQDRSRQHSEEVVIPQDRIK
jgi:hypothetical protein